VAVIALVDLQNAMSPATVMAIFDDANDGIIVSSAVEAVITRAEAQVYSFISRNYPDLTIPVTASPAPEALRSAVLEFAIVYCRDRKPEYWSKSQEREREQRIKGAFELAERYAKAEQILYDSGQTPANVGGFVGSGDPLLPEPKLKFFADDMGDF